MGRTSPAVPVHPVLAELRARMQEKGLTVRQLAEQAGVSPNALFQWLNGTVSPTLSTLEKVLNTLELGLQVSTPLVPTCPDGDELGAKLLRGETNARQAIRTLCKRKKRSLIQVTREAGYPTNILYREDCNNLTINTFCNLLNALNVRMRFDHVD